MGLGQKILIGIGATLLLFFLFLALLPALVNMERYRDAIAERMGKALGRPLSVGAIRLSPFALGVEVRGIQISERPAFGERPFVEAEALKVRFNLLPLLKGQVKVREALLEKPRIILIRDREGRWNVEDLFPPRPPLHQPLRQGGRGREPEAKRVGRASLFPGLALGELKIRKARVTLETPGLGVRRDRSASLDLDVSRASFQDPIRFHLTATFDDDLGSLEASGDIGPWSEDGPPVKAALTARGLQAASWLRSLNKVPFHLTGGVDGRLTLHGPWKRLALRGDMNLRNLGISFRGISPKAVGEEGWLQFQGRQEGTGLVFDQIRLTTKTLTVKGSLRIADLKHPEIRFSLSSPRLELQDLLAASSPSPPWVRGVAWAAVGHGAPAKSPEGGRGLAASGEVHVADVRWGTLRLRNLSSEVLYNHPILKLENLTASMYGGKLTAEVKVDLTGRWPRLTLNSRLEEVRTEPLLKALRQEHRWLLEGILNVQSKVKVHGPLNASALGAASGEGRVAIREGRLKGYAPLERVMEALAPLLAARGLDIHFGEFDDLKGHFILEKGSLRTRDLTLRKGEGILTAVGSLGLLDSSLDFDVTAKLPKATLEAKLTGTVMDPIVVPKKATLRRRIEIRIPKKEEGGRLKGLLRELFKK